MDAAREMPQETEGQEVTHVVTFFLLICFPAIYISFSDRRRKLAGRPTAKRTRGRVEKTRCIRRTGFVGMNKRVNKKMKLIN